VNSILSFCFSSRNRNARTRRAHPLLALLALAGLLFVQAPGFSQAPPPRPPGAPGNPPAVPGNPGGATPTPGGPAATPIVDPLPAGEDIQLSFQGANIDTVVQWLAKATGKSVIKHPRAQCQLTIVSSRKLKARDAINLVYRALALEGFSAAETSNSILILPEGQEPKIGPELVNNTQQELPDGRQRLMKIFPLKNIPPAELRDKIRSALSDKAVVEIADRANQIIITDFPENIRLVGELIRELDVPAGGDVQIQFYSLKYSEADELASLLTLVLNAQSPPPSSPTRSPVPMRAPGSPMISGPGGGPGNPGMPSSPGSDPGTSNPPGGAAAGLQVRIWTDKTSNRLIVAAPKAKLAEVERLIQLLDTEKPQDVSIRVLTLKNVNAEDLVRELGPLFSKMSGKSVKESIEVSANSRANALIILSNEANYKAIEALVGSLDTDNAQERALQAFPLKNADAEDVARQLQELNQDTGTQNRYPFYIYSSSPMGKTPVKPNFVADRRRNTVIVQAAPGAMNDIAKLISELDQPITDEGLAPKIFRLKYVSAVDIEDILNELFLKKQQQRTYWDPYSGYPTRETDQQGSGRLSGKVRITSEPYANAIIVTAVSPEILNAVEAILKELDVPSQAGETTFRVELRFAKATTVANGINILFARGGSPPLRATPQQNQPGVPTPQQQQNGGPPANSFELEQEIREDMYFPWLGGQPENQRSADGRNVNRPISDLVGRVRVVPDPRSNSLLISANLHLYPQVLKLIQDMDAPTPQVLIEAKILEVGTDYMDRLGVRWSPEGGATFTAEDLDNSIIANTRGSYHQGFGGKTEVTSLSADGIASALSTLRSGTVSSVINLDFLVQFLKKTTDASVLSEPQINVADNEVGKLFVGQQVPFIERSQSTDVGALNQTFSYKNVGVILEVTPHINTAGDVALKIRAESSAIVPGQTLFGGAILDTRNFKTDVTVKDGETLVLGGIIQRQISDTVRKTPGLGSIPGLGWIFKKKDSNHREVELLVFLRPRVVRTSDEARTLLDEVEKKMPLIKKDSNSPRKNDGDAGKDPAEPRKR